MKASDWWKHRAAARRRSDDSPRGFSHGAPGLKPACSTRICGTAKAVPFHRLLRASIPCTLLLIALASPALAQNRCGAGKDLVVQALERVPPGSNASTLEDGVELLKHAIGECESLGDAWYYRSLLERKLGNARKADYSLQKARDNNSEALQQNLDPFTLSTRPNVPPSNTVRDKWALV